MCSFRDDSNEMDGNCDIVKTALEDQEEEVFPVRVLSERVTRQGNFFEVITIDAIYEEISLSNDFFVL